MVRWPARVVSAVVPIVSAACADDGPGRDGSAGGCPLTPIATASIPELAAGTSAGTSAGLLFTTPPIRAGTEVKIVWRLTGTGQRSVVAADPSRLLAPAGRARGCSRDVWLDVVA